MSDRSLLPPSAHRYERALGDVTARLSDVPAPIRPLWNPDTCPAELLPWLAWTMGLSAWKPYWSESIKRERIRQAVEIHRRRGTKGSVRRVVESFGAGVSIREWWQMDPPGEPHTFELVMTVRGDNTAGRLQEDIIEEVWRVKPVRAHFTFIAGVIAEGGIGHQGAVRPVIYRRLDLTEG
ncbi:phage tail protein I [Halomonas elongata]|uniref:phage tail protein I n=1 Tax=Halomonas elongata TaxID=2746 RepID=UPI0038D3BB91